MGDLKKIMDNIQTSNCITPRGQIIQRHVTKVAEIQCNLMMATAEIQKYNIEEMERVAVMTERIMAIDFTAINNIMEFFN